MFITFIFIKADQAALKEFECLWNGLFNDYEGTEQILFKRKGIIR